MSYNKYRWWTKGRTNKPLKADAPLLLKIRNGDFDYSYMFKEALEVRQSAQKVYEQTYKKCKRQYRFSQRFNNKLFDTFHRSFSIYRFVHNYNL